MSLGKVVSVLSCRITKNCCCNIANYSKNGSRNASKACSKSLAQNKVKIYQKTWADCPPRKLDECILCSETEDPITPKRAKLRSTQGQQKLIQDRFCPRVVLGECRTIKTLKCKPDAAPSDCLQKINPPYPSYSECIREPYLPEPFSECTCWNKKCVPTDTY